MNENQIVERLIEVMLKTSSEKLVSEFQTNDDFRVEFLNGVLWYRKSIVSYLVDFDQYLLIIERLCHFYPITKELLELVIERVSDGNKELKIKNVIAEYAKSFSDRLIEYDSGFSSDIREIEDAQKKIYKYLSQDELNYYNDQIEELKNKKRIIEDDINNLRESVDLKSINKNTENYRRELENIQKLKEEIEKIKSQTFEIPSVDVESIKNELVNFFLQNKS